METNVVPIGQGSLEERLQNRIAIRKMGADEFVNKHASGTLRKNKSLGMAWRSQYLHERVAYEFGWEFECLPRSRIMFGDAYTEGDCSAITEAGWHIERYMNLNIFPEDKIEAKYIHVEYPCGERKEGIGMIIRETSAPFIPAGNLVYSIVAEYDTKKEKWKKANNPF
jgi:hypothetical protein